VQVDGETVGAILDSAVELWGQSFAQLLQRSQVWVNGGEAERDTRVCATDEVAIIPPVSGGDH